MRFLAQEPPASRRGQFFRDVFEKLRQVLPNTYDPSPCQPGVAIQA